MKKLSLSIVLLAIATNISAQLLEECGTPYSEPPQWVLTDVATKSATEYESIIYKINVHVVILQTANGEGHSESAGQTVVDRLNNFYNRYGLWFVPREATVVRDDNYSIHYNDDIPLLLKSRYGKSDEITIFLLSDKTSTYYAGRAGGIRSNYLCIAYDYYDKSTVEHEMGHCLGLYHTHHGTIEKPGCPELVNGSNSSTCGDFITDTPADPYIWHPTECLYAGTSKDVDANGEQYHPDPYNVMSYAAKECRTEMTPGQIIRIKDMLDRENILKAVCTSISMKGASTLCDEEVYTVEGLPDGAEVRWGYKGGSKPVYPPVVIKSEDGATAVYERGVQIKDEMEEPPVVIGTSEQTNSSSGTEPYVGSVTITATVTLGGNAYMLEKEVTMNEIVTPDISGATKIGQTLPPGTMPITWYPNKTRTLSFVYTGSSETGLIFLPILYYTNIDWEVTHPDGTMQYGSGRSISITPKTHGRLKVKITDGNQCRLANSYTAEYLITPYLTQLTFTNPASRSVDISVKETAAGTQEGVAAMSADAEVYAEPYMGEYRLELWHEVYGMVREMDVEAGNPTVTMDLGGLTPGWYYVRLIADGEMKAVGKLMVR